jgi:hypothetical protein
MRGAGLGRGFAGESRPGLWLADGERKESTVMGRALSKVQFSQTPTPRGDERRVRQRALCPAIVKGVLIVFPKFTLKECACVYGDAPSGRRAFS